MSVRWARDDERPALVQLLQSAEAGCQGYDFVSMDGACLVDEHEGPDGQMVLRGMALISLARPATIIREIAIRPEHRKSWVLANLSAAIFAAARAHGSVAVEGFKAASNPEWIAFSRDRGAVVHEGARIRWMLDSEPVVQLLSRRERTNP